MKTSILQAVKTHNAANTTDRLNTKFLTQKARRLYFLARDRAKICRYDFCWSASGRIFLRKAVGSAPIVITS
ncbi:hypothetical protein OBRU01_18146 [Operophtera brumata]|uniref:FP protein C-terminal domain-containing protein n=1 Tax=Operophtera brumata TaxID=104452 RepID=A0A0L7L2U6_OPEBR|nr:hypothetical protein OBRU01_18146 [Operophtera brumata]